MSGILPAAVLLACSFGGSPDEPLPAASTLLEGLADRQRSYEQELNDYTYDVEVVREQLDGQGRVKSRKANRFEIFFVKGRRVRRLVAENGAPLSAQRQAKVDAKVREYVDGVLLAKPDKRRRNIELSQLIERYDFRSLARETIDGRSAVVLEFQPRPGKSQLQNDNVLRRLVGRLWVDETERFVVRSEIRNSGGIKFALGLGASLSDLEVTTDFVKVDDRIWLPKQVETRVVGRVMLLKGLRERTTSSFSGYRRFETSAEEGPKRPR